MGCGGHETRHRLRCPQRRLDQREDERDDEARDERGLQAGGEYAVGKWCEVVVEPRVRGLNSVDIVGAVTDLCGGWIDSRDRGFVDVLRRLGTCHLSAWGTSDSGLKVRDTMVGQHKYTD
ncbi:hypothetical protein SESBI_40526 [Sesbania bispinosa]|nr:hypothetical protein SESBI_40526 [Sesbania bispinosa]